MCSCESSHNTRKHSFLRVQNKYILKEISFFWRSAYPIVEEEEMGARLHKREENCKKSTAINARIKLSQSP